MKEQMKVTMNALKGQVSNDLDDLVNRIDSPFTTSVNSFPLAQKFCMPQIESYNGVKDPLDQTFKTPDAPSRSTKRDHVYGLPYDAKGSCENLVQ